MDDDAKKLTQRYLAACHAMQTAVLIDQTLNHNESEKHLRVGINSALVDHGALVGLLVKKGIITDLEYRKALAEGMEAEVERYRKLLDLPLNVDVK